MDGDKADETHIPSISSPDRKKEKRKRKMSSTYIPKGKEEEDESLNPSLGLPNVQEAFRVGAPTPEDSLKFISTMDERAYDWDTGEMIDQDDIMNGEDVEVESLLFGGTSARSHEAPEALFDGQGHRGVRKVIIDQQTPRVAMVSSSEEWMCHKCNSKFPAVQMLWTHIDTCKSGGSSNLGLPPVPPVSHFATGHFGGDIEEDVPDLEIPRYRKRRGPVYVRNGGAWEWKDEDDEEVDGRGVAHREYVPEGMSFEQQMEAALRASQGLNYNEDKEAQFEEDTLRAIEMSVSGMTPEAMRLIELHREIDDMAIATAASLQTLSLKEFDCGWTKWETSFQKRDHPTFKVDAEPRHAMLWDILKIMHGNGWLNTCCPKCYTTRHGGSCIHFRPFDLSFLFKMRSVCFSWMCVIDAWMAQWRIKKVVFTCTRCRVLGSKQKGTHLSQYYYTENWEKTNIKLVNDYEMPNEEFECEFEGDH